MTPEQEKKIDDLASQQIIYDLTGTNPRFADKRCKEYRRFIKGAYAISALFESGEFQTSRERELVDALRACSPAWLPIEVRALRQKALDDLKENETVKWLEKSITSKPLKNKDGV